MQESWARERAKTPPLDKRGPPRAPIVVGGTNLCQCFILLLRTPAPGSKAAEYNSDEQNRRIKLIGDLKKRSYNNTDASLRVADISHYGFYHFVHYGPFKFSNSEEVLQFIDKDGVTRTLKLDNHGDFRKAIEELIRCQDSTFKFYANPRRDRDNPRKRGRDEDDSEALSRERTRQDEAHKKRKIVGGDKEEEYGVEGDWDVAIRGTELSEKDNLEYNKRIIKQHYQSLRDCVEIEQFDDKTWNRCCEFFRLEHTDHEPTTSFSLPGYFKKVGIHQAYAVYLMMKWERSMRGGGFLADEDGLGRRDELAVLCVVNRILANAHQDVENDRKDPDPARQHRHLPSSSIRPQAENAKCPLEAAGEHPFPICCPCVESSPSGSLQPKRGPVLILVPHGTIDTYARSLTRRIHFDEAQLRMKLYVFSDGSPAVDANSRRLLESATTNAMPKLDQERLIILTSSKIYSDKVEKLWGKASGSSYDLDIAWGRVIKEHCHLQKARNSRTIGILKRLKGSPFLWASSNTPCEDEPGDLQAYVDFLFENAPPARWSEHRDLQWAKNLHEVNSNYHLLLRNGVGCFSISLSSFIKEFKHVLQGLMIRRTSYTRWFGKDIGISPRTILQMEDIHTTTKAGFENDLAAVRRVAEWELQREIKYRRERWYSGDDSDPGLPVASFEVWLDLARILRMTSTIPALARFAINGELPLSVDIEQQWYISYDDAMQSPYYKNIDVLAKSSNKFREIEKKLKDVGAREKIIIVSSFPIIAFITYLWLKKANYKVVIVHDDGGDNYCGAQKARFFGTRMEGYDEFGIELDKDASEATILVGTIDTLPPSYSLYKATRLFLLERAWERLDEQNMWSHLEKVLTTQPAIGYKCLCDDSITEQLIERRHNNTIYWNQLTFKEPGDSSTFGTKTPDSIPAIFQEADDYITNPLYTPENQTAWAPKRPPWKAPVTLPRPQGLRMGRQASRTVITLDDEDGDEDIKITSVSGPNLPTRSGTPAFIDARSSREDCERYRKRQGKIGKAKYEKERQENEAAYWEKEAATKAAKNANQRPRQSRKPTPGPTPEQERVRLITEQREADLELLLKEGAKYKGWGAQEAGYADPDTFKKYESYGTRLQAAQKLVKKPVGKKEQPRTPRPEEPRPPQPEEVPPPTPPPKPTATASPSLDYDSWDEV